MFVAQREGSADSRNTPLQRLPGLSILGEPLGFSVSQMATGQAGITVPAGGGPCTDPPLQQPDLLSSPFMWDLSSHGHLPGPLPAPQRISCLGDESLD